LLLERRARLNQRVSQGAFDPACARHARGVVVDFDQIYIAPIKPAIEQRRLKALRGDEEL
jgi:hypothetical protein